ncbi:hypothetical protein [Paraflavitalea pollutisoli]|uniref:hypothetical protein n=1 Tax=Paraflavitalea pollutisoli TaxID=3034143 RepID=UPI0023EDB6F0|nr:hypothetical protein [Paraflavitalea sp. H1-2-19X]
MNPQARIYVSGAFCFGKQVAVSNLLEANYNAIIVWSLHVNAAGDLIMNNTPIVTNGVYSEQQTMDLPARLATLYQKGISVIFSVGAGGTSDFTNINNLINQYGIGPDNPLYTNFSVLKSTMVNAGGNIDAIDFDNEDLFESGVMIQFGSMLHDIGYSSVTFCPYFDTSLWQETLQELTNRYGPNFVSAFHLQCYSGGAGNVPSEWGKVIAQCKSNALLIPGLATNQAGPGTWWQSSTNQPGSSVKTYPNVAQYGNGDWSSVLRQGNYPSADAAMQSCIGGETFFFYCNQAVGFGGKVFQQGDAVFFGGNPQWGSAPQCTSYALANGCSNIYNNNGACPNDLQAQFGQWAKQPYPPTGGFIWLYDSIVNCVLSGPCGEGGDTVATVCSLYKEAIIQGVGQPAATGKKPALSSL